MNWHSIYSYGFPILALIISLFSLYKIWKYRNKIQVQYDVVRQINAVANNPEPDHLISTWRQGYVQGLKTLCLNYAYYSGTDKQEVYTLIKTVNNINVIRELDITFFIRYNGKVEWLGFEGEFTIDIVDNKTNTTIGPYFFENSIV